MNAKICSLPLALSAAAVISFYSCSKSEQVLSEISGNTNPAGLESQTAVSQEEIDRAIYIPGSVIVRFTADAAAAIENKSADPLADVAEQLGLKHIERLFPDAGEFERRSREMGLHQYYVIEFDSSTALSQAQVLLESLDEIESFEKRSVIRVVDSMNDPYYSYLWEYFGAYDIRVEEAWKYTVGDPSVAVCVVDGGVQLDHEDLSWNCGTTHYNFVSNRPDIVADTHGTHVAGTIAAVGNNKVGIAGIAGGNYAKGRKGTKILSAQVFMGEEGARNFQNAIKWGADNGALISQNSWGNDYDFNRDGKLSSNEITYALNDRISPSMAAAVDYFIRYAGCDSNGEQKPDSPMKGGVVVFAAGNDGIANGVPASYEPIVAVGSTGKSGRLSYFSNYGPWVDICAPGEDICSTVPAGSYAMLSGTSMACPHVSGSLALMIAQFGQEGFTNADLIEILLSGANPGLIDNRGKEAGPYLDVLGSIKYGVDKYRRENNNPPVILTGYSGDYKFRQWENVSIPFVVSDPDGDKVDVIAEIEGRARFNPDATADSLYNFTLMCELVDDFTPKKVKITATDLYDGVAEMEFTYQVMENQAPKVSGTVEDSVIPASGEAFIDIDGIFEDPDAEPLLYSVSVNPSNVAKAAIEGTKLKISKLQNGLATVTVKANDYMGAKASVSFKILSRDESTPFDYYPNPVKDYLNIRTSNAKPQDVGVKISTQLGAAVFDRTIECGAFEPGRIDMTGFAPGRYVLQVNINEKEYSNNIVKR